MKKVFALVLALVMVLALSATAFAQTVNSGKGGPASITITLPTEETRPSGTTTYKIYKVFDATSDGTSSAISYKLVDGKTTVPAGFSVDTAGNVTYSGASTNGQLTADDIAAIKAYVANDEVFYTATVPAGEASVEVTGLPYGYYYITTSTGTVVTIDSTNPNAEVIDKNTIPKPPKKTIGADFEGYVDAAGKNAIAQVGKTVPFSVEIEVENGAKDYVFHDVMSTGLTYNPSSLVVDPAASVLNTTTATGDTLTVTFNNTWLAAHAGETIKITYNATINSDALTIDYANNTASLDYGEGHTTEKDIVKIYTGSIEATKVDGKNTPATDDDSPLAGAGFVLARDIAPVGTEGEAGYVAGYREYYKLVNGAVTWVRDIADADEHVSGEDGKIAAFVGLTSGSYVLEEKTVPAGYNKVADITGIVVPQAQVDNAGNLTNAAALKVNIGNIINNKGTELPSTGGIGTTLFYVVGALMMAAAVVLLITKKRVGNVK